MRKLTIQSPDYSITLPKLILGSTMFGTPENRVLPYGKSICEEQAFRLMDRYAELGGFCIDTAKVYGDWDDKDDSLSEKTIAKWLDSRKKRDNVIVITKGLHPRFYALDVSRVMPECLSYDIEHSLRNLKTDVIDIYLTHEDNEKVPVSALMPVLDRYVKEGKIKIIGASNWSAERVAEANRFADENGLTPFAVTEVNWALAVETPEHCMFPESPFLDDGERKKYMDMGMPILAWASQAGGVVTRVAENGWDSISEGLRLRYYNDTTIKRIENVKRISKDTGLTATQLALAYITCNEAEGAALIGPSTIEHMDSSMAAGNVEISLDIVNALTE